MPRGRKCPPQESIDSILLAISRRDDITAETLSHYFDRLNEEWSHGARTKVLHLLRSHDPAAHTAALLILSELATNSDLEELEDVIADPTIRDSAKLTVSPVLKVLGSDMADDGLIEYLNDPIAAMQQMQMRLLDLSGQSEIGVETLLEDVLAMPVERRLGFISWLASSQDARAANLLVPLLETQPPKIVAVVIEALEELGPVAGSRTLPALNHLIATSSNRSIKQQARATLGRLTMQSVPGGEAEAEPFLQQSTPYEAYATFIDGSGSLLIMLSWQRPDGLLKGVNVLYQDQWGVKDCYGVDGLDTTRWKQLVADLDQKGFGSFTAPFELGQALITEARALNKRTRRKLPIAYAVWRPLIEGEGEEAVKTHTPSLLTMAEPLALTPDTLELAHHGAELYQLQEFISWIYEPIGRLEPYMTRYWSTASFVNVPAFSSLSPASTSGRKKSEHAAYKKTEGQRLLLEELITEALSSLTDETWRTLYEARLRRQAALFQGAGRKQDTLLIRAVAALLAPNSQVSISEQPFARAMIRASIEQGPLRIILGSLGEDALNLFPLHPIDEE